MLMMIIVVRVKAYLGEVADAVLTGGEYFSATRKYYLGTGN